MSTREAAVAALRRVPAPGGGDVVSAGLVRALTVEGGAARFVMEVAPAEAAAHAPVRAAAEAALAALPGIETANVLLTAHSDAPAPDLKPKPAPSPQRVPGVERIVAVASGKGGVGKSTLSANLAVALAAEGRRVGLLDADVYGPSQPRMMGVSKRPAHDGTAIEPPRAHGIAVMSMGLLVDEGQGVVWRGPMLMKALQQMMLGVAWGALDVLIVDLPPGTGDVQLTLCQRFEVTGAVVVSTPQDVALLDARKGIDMLRKLDVPLLGLVENMSTHICSNCGHEEHIFGHGGVAAEADRLGVPLLAEIPLHLAIRVAADEGTPVAAGAAPQAEAYRALARTLVAAGHA